uniref:(northern house mosquito) hypothetical protein n=1 Tax=Culex pipiens TaxID=7175 RepID=A0A8D8I4Y8_CULPI
MLWVTLPTIVEQSARFGSSSVCVRSRTGESALDLLIVKNSDAPLVRFNDSRLPPSFPTDTTSSCFCLTNVSLRFTSYVTFPSLLSVTVSLLEAIFNMAAS